MDFKDLIKHLADRVVKLKDSIQTEEATKNAFIMPFIQALGYDVFDPHEVIPEFVSDIGIKKGEKIDYAIFKDGHPILLVECKHLSQNLDLHDGQLLRYFHVSKAKFGLLTNGVIYRFYSDLLEKNKMDETPFLEFNITEIKETQVEELKKFHKSYFDAELISNTASDLKYMNDLKAKILSDLNNPGEQFVKLYASQVYSGRITEKVYEQFKDLTSRSTTSLLNDIVTQRLQSALKKEEVEQKALESNQTIQTQKIETTEEEIYSHIIIRAILAKNIDPSRVFLRDAQSYCSIILDDNNRKPIVRLYYTSGKKQIGIFDSTKNETKYQIEKIEDIYKFSDQLLESVKSLEN
jgi:predicted type IV restriction endonuclease